MGAGLDIRETGGSVVLPGSLHVSGRVYEYELSHGPEDVPLAPMPVWLLTLLQSRSNGRTSSRPAPEPGPIPNGTVHYTFVSWAGTMHRRGMFPAAILAALQTENATRCAPVRPTENIHEIVEDITTRYLPGPMPEERPTPWALAKAVPAFLAEEEKEFQGLAKDLLAPGAITLVAAPRGLGKTQFSHALAVALTTPGGVFRGERVSPARVLLVDRDNPESLIKKRLRTWGAAHAPHLRVLTRQHAPDLKDKEAWAAFPITDYDAVIVDSVGASTEGITEKEGRQTTEVLATVLNLARQGIAMLLLQNATKDGVNLKGRGEWADRADIVYEVRDATGFAPSGKKAWWQELPEAGEAAWAERATRRKGRVDFRLAFVPSKFRLGAEPEPSCVELHLPKDEPWTLRDVTTEILRAGEEVVAKATQQKNEKQEKAAAALAEVVKDRAVTDAPLLKTEAEEYLHQEERLSRDAARAVISEKENVLWRIEQIQASKGRPKALYPVSFQTDEPRKSDPFGNPRQMGASEPSISAGTDSKPCENTLSLETNKTGTSRGTLFSRPEKSTTAEIGSQKSPSNVAYRGKAIFADDEIEDAEVIE